MKSIKNFFQTYGAEILLCLAGFTLIFLLLWFRLGSLTYGNAAAIEVASRQSAATWSAIVDNPLNAPYKVVQRVVMYTGHNGVTSMRLVSTVWAIGAMVLFYIVARQWHSARVAGLATWLFISSSWFLHTARLATPEILWLVGVLALVVLFTPSRNPDRNKFALLLYSMILSAIIYIPGMIWLVIVSFIVQRKNLASAWRSSPSFFLRGLSILLSLAIMTPLILSFIIQPRLVMQWLGLGPSFTDPLLIGERLLAIPVQLFALGPYDPVHWLGRLPLLSVFEILMFILGVYFYATHFQAARSRFIILLSAIAILVIAVGGIASISLLIPAVYLFVATGIAYMLRQWLQVFPYNPIARAIGILVIVLVVLLTSIYHTRSYFVAWRYSPDTAKVFDQKL